MSHDDSRERERQSIWMLNIHFSYPCFSHRFPCTGPIPGTQVTGLIVIGSLANVHWNYCERKKFDFNLIEYLTCFFVQRRGGSSLLEFIELVKVR